MGQGQTRPVAPPNEQHLWIQEPVNPCFTGKSAGDAWDAQKRKVAAEDSRGRKRSATGRTVFVTKPSAEFMGAVFGAGARLTAEDGVHPNEWGYAAWAHHIASEVAEVLAARAETRKPGPERFVSREGEGTEWAPS